MGQFILAVILLLALAENADAGDLIARNGKDWVRLHDRACTDKAVLAVLPPADHGQFRAASVQYEDKLYAACWTVVPQGVMLQYGDGDRGGLPFMAFTPAPEV